MYIINKIIVSVIFSEMSLTTEAEDQAHRATAGD